MCVCVGWGGVHRGAADTHSQAELLPPSELLILDQATVSLLLLLLPPHW